jgi:hypothetical protein
VGSVCVRCDHSHCGCKCDRKPCPRCGEKRPEPAPDAVNHPAHELSLLAIEAAQHGTFLTSTSKGWLGTAEVTIGFADIEDAGRFMLAFAKAVRSMRDAGNEN